MKKYKKKNILIGYYQMRLFCYSALIFRNNILQKDFDKVLIPKLNKLYLINN